MSKTTARVRVETGSRAKILYRTRKTSPSRCDRDYNHRHESRTQTARTDRAFQTPSSTVQPIGCFLPNGSRSDDCHVRPMPRRDPPRAADALVDRAPDGPNVSERRDAHHGRRRPRGHRAVRSSRLAGRRRKRTPPGSPRSRMKRPRSGFMSSHSRARRSRQRPPWTVPGPGSSSIPPG